MAMKGRAGGDYRTLLPTVLSAGQGLPVLTRSTKIVPLRREPGSVATNLKTKVSATARTDRSGQGDGVGHGYSWVLKGYSRGTDRSGHGDGGGPARDVLVL